MSVPFNDAAFPNGISSGDVTQTSAVLWTRAVETGKLVFEVATDPFFDHVVKTKTLTVTDPLVPVKTQVKGLAAGTQYFYRAIDASGDSITGTFGTPQKLGAYAGFHFAVLGDMHSRLVPYVDLKNAVGADFDLIIKLGDTVTQDLPTGTPGISQVNDGELETFQDVYATSFGSHFGFNFLGELQAKAPILAIPDDHEVLDDYAGGALPSEDTRIPSEPGADFINETAFFKTAMQAFSQYNAIEDRVYKGTGEDRFDGTPDLYRYNTYGSDAAIIMVDGRSFRDAEIAHLSDVPIDAGGFPSQTFLEDAFTPGRTLLGNVQLERLKEDLLDARDKGITWKLIVLPETIQNFGPGIRPGDRYEGYQAERNELLKFIDQNHIENVVFVTADTHWTMVNNLTYVDDEGHTVQTSAFDVNTISVGDPSFASLVPGVAASLNSAFAPLNAIYPGAPVLPDADSALNDKDDIVKFILNQVMLGLGYDPIGLGDINNNPIPGSRIDATLLQGDYFVGHNIGWTDFDIDPSQKLTVTTWGIQPYTASEIADPGNTASILARTPAIVSQFEVTPTHDSIIGTAKRDKVQGTDQGDVVLGAAGSDTLRGKAGDDYVDGGKGNDFVFADAGDDRLYGRGGADELRGGAGNDTIEGGTGADRAFGGQGDDTFVATKGDGNDTYKGGAGQDTLDLSATAAAASVSLRNDTASSVDIGHDKLSSIENVKGGSGDDRLTGNSAANRLDGGAGADTLDGGRGDDHLIGGLGDDTFLFKPGFGNDTVEDFAVGSPGSHDTLDLRALHFADLAAVWAATIDVGPNAVIHVGSDSITLLGVTLGDLQAHPSDVIIA